MVLSHSVDEYLDIVDENDNVIGKKKRSLVYAENLSNFRVVNAFVVNSHGKIWIPRRSANKTLYPLSLDVSIGGHVESGEDYADALIREAHEELNINIDELATYLLGHLRPKDGVSSFMNVYEIQTDKLPDFNKNDFSEYFMLTPRELVELISSGEKAKSDLIKLIKFFYL
jgi:isopentenyl-diphosphate delta-isomerase